MTTCERSELYRKLISELLFVSYQPSADNTERFPHALLNGSNPAQVVSELYSLESHSQEQIQKISKDIFGISCIDHEGGRVHRLGETMPPLPSAYAIRRTNNLQLAYKAGELAGKQLAELGIKMSLGPVCDIGGENSSFPSRCFGDNPDDVIAYAGTYLSGLKKHVLVNLKHYPGHGSLGEEDSHLCRSTVNVSKDELVKTHMRPFFALASQADSIMTAHIIVKDMDPEIPATYSKPVLDYLPINGFEGVILSDSMTMKGADLNEDNDFVKKAMMALNAGCSALLLGHTTLEDAKNLQMRLVEACLLSDQFTKTVEMAAEKIQMLIEKQKNLMKSDIDITTINQKVLKLANTIAHLAIYQNEVPYYIQKDTPVVIFSPILLNESVTAGFSRSSFTHLAGLHTWNDLAPTDAEVSHLMNVAEQCQTIIVISYNGERHLSQQNLVRLLKTIGRDICVCEVNYTPPHSPLKWLPDDTKGICTYSGDSTSICVAFEKLAIP